MENNSKQVESNNCKELYFIGGVAGIVVSILVVMAIIAYFIWPYAASETPMKEIFQNLHSNPIGGLISLDLIMLVTMIVYTFVIISLYPVLKHTNAFYALIALCLGLIGVATVITSRPLLEMLTLSQKYALSADENMRMTLLNAGETLRLKYDGTAWFLQIIFFMVSGLLYSILMLKGNDFRNSIAWMGIIASLIGLFFWIPKIGLVFLFLNTVLTIPWCFLVGITLLNKRKKKI